MKIIYHYENKCSICKNYGDELGLCKLCKHNNNFSFLAVNKNYAHYFNNEEEFIKYTNNNFGEYKTILPKNYYVEYKLQNNLEYEK